MKLLEGYRSSAGTAMTNCRHRICARPTSDWLKWKANQQPQRQFLMQGSILPTHRVMSSNLFRYPIKCIIVTWQIGVFKKSDRFGTGQSPRYQCCQGKCPIPECSHRHKRKFEHKFHVFETLRDTETTLSLSLSLTCFRHDSQQRHRHPRRPSCLQRHNYSLLGRSTTRLHRFPIIRTQQE